MIYLIQLKTTASRVLIPLALVCFAVLPKVQAVSPPPDGGYPGGNTAEGQAALLSLTTGGFNTAVGFLSLRSDTTAGFNTAVGAGALLANGGDANSATGAGALLSNTTGFQNTANGAFALFNNTTGEVNTANGHEALVNNTSGNFNIGIGFNGGRSLTTGDLNIDIGAAGLAGESNTIRIGSLGNHTRAFITGIRGVTTGNMNAIPVLIDSAGQLGTVSSSQRFKKEIKPMEKASEAILALKPVTFHYNSDSSGTPQFGLIAEDVAEVNPDLVVRDENGEIYTVRYDAVNAMLLNEFLKEHRRVDKLQETLARQQESFEAKLAEQNKRIEILTAGLETVSAQIQLSKTPPVMADSSY